MIRIGLLITGFLLAFATVEAAETTTKSTPAATPSTPTTGVGAYAKLSPGNQKTADALYKAQTNAPSGTMGSMPGYTREQIATMKQSGQRWDQIFHQMKAQGLVKDKSLAQVISRYNQLAKSGGTKPDSSRH